MSTIEIKYPLEADIKIFLGRIIRDWENTHSKQLLVTDSGNYIMLQKTKKWLKEATP